MNRALISRAAGVVAIAATALLGAGTANAQVSMSQPGSQIQAGSQIQLKTAGAQATKAASCRNYAYSTGDWVRIRATPGGEPVLGYSMRFDHYSDAAYPNDYRDGYMLATNLRTGVRGWVSLAWTDWYQPTCY
ncbi:hypothetical protein AB0A63_31380 [Lentzea sp. NPDC042327]|uniref:hypothetical protein n=1 Tax=Lentzea sp. NPDC042327 TaxID=3154801 RepID=UPI0034021794